MQWRPWTTIPPPCTVETASREMNAWSYNESDMMHANRIDGGCKLPAWREQLPSWGTQRHNLTSQLSPLMRAATTTHKIKPSTIAVAACVQGAGCRALHHAWHGTPQQLNAITPQLLTRMPGLAGHRGTGVRPCVAS